MCVSQYSKFPWFVHVHVVQSNPNPEIPSQGGNQPYTETIGLGTVYDVVHSQVPTWDHDRGPAR